MPATVSSRSSISRKDMWQPEQPSSHTVARRFLLIQPHSPRRTRRYTKETPYYQGHEGTRRKPFTTKVTKAHEGNPLPPRSRRHTKETSTMNSFVRLRALRGSSSFIRFLPASWSGRAGTDAA